MEARENYHDFNTKQLIELYGTTVVEEASHVSFFDRRLAYFVSFIATIFGAIIAGAMVADAVLEFAMLAGAAMFSGLVTQTAKFAFLSGYKRWITILMMRIKLEYALGFHEKTHTGRTNERWYADEPLTFPEHVENRTRNKNTQKEYSSSDEFYKAQQEAGMGATGKRIFDVAYFVATILFLILCAQGIYIFLED